MEKFKGEIIIKPFNPGKHTIENIGNHIHQQLVGNEDYIKSNIGIELQKDQVFIWIDDCEGDIPDIVI